MKINSYVIKKLEQGYNIEQIFDEPIYVASLCAMRHDKLREVKPTQVSVELKKDYTLEKVFTQSFLHHNRHPELFHYSVLRMLDFYPIDEEGNRLKTQIKYMGKEYKDKSMTSYYDSSLEFFDTMEEAVEYYMQQTVAIKQ